MTLPFPDDTFDVAVMPLVIFFVPDLISSVGVTAFARFVDLIAIGRFRIARAIVSRDLTNDSKSHSS